MSSTYPSDHHKGYRHPFLFGVHYLGGVGDAPRTLVELAMSQLSAEIRRIPSWWILYRDQAKRQEWTDSAVGRVWKIKAPSTYSDVVLSVKQIKYVLDELEGYAALRDDINNCQVSCFERIWESHELLDSNTTDLLNAELTSLQTQSRSEAYAHATDIIDPSRYCLVYNTTLVSQYNGRSLRPIPPPPSTDIYTISSHFALLPADVYVNECYRPKFLSYINNLHPEHHGKIYCLLETILGRSIPLFEHCLTDLHRNNPLHQRICGCYKYQIWDEPDPPEHSDDEEGWTNYEREVREWSLNRPINLPDVPELGYQSGMETRKHYVTLKNKTLQVIVRVSRINLNAEAPDYAGDAWHVEGMRGERIVACGVHYLSNNITDASLQFRMAVTYPRGFTAGDTGATLRTWGIRDGDSCHQYIGNVPIQSGLSLVFPNIYQYHQSKFALADPSRAGELTALLFCLVDPDINPIVSTAAVAPQQKEWIREALDKTLDPRLPHEIVDKIMDFVEGVMTVEEAQEYQRRLRESREQFTQANNNYHFCIPFDIWNGPEVLF